MPRPYESSTGQTPVSSRRLQSDLAAPDHRMMRLATEIRASAKSSALSRNWNHGLLCPWTLFDRVLFCTILRRSLLSVGCARDR